MAWSIESKSTGMVIGSGRTEDAAWRHYRRECERVGVKLDDPVAVELKPWEIIGLRGGIVCRTEREYIPPPFDPRDCGGAFDGTSVYSDADPGL